MKIDNKQKENVEQVEIHVKIESIKKNETAGQELENVQKMENKNKMENVKENDKMSAGLYKKREVLTETKKKERKYKYKDKDGFQKMPVKDRCKRPVLDMTRFKDWNRFSVLENEKATDQILKEEVVITCTSNDFPAIKAKVVKKKIIQKLRNQKFSSKESQSSSTNFLLITRCKQCFLSHFPITRICRKENIKTGHKDRDNSEASHHIGCFNEITIQLIKDKIMFLKTRLNEKKSVDTLYGSSEDLKTIRLIGGARNHISQTDNMVEKAIESGRKHGITLERGVESVSDGNCTFESVLDNINNRACFKTKVPFSSTTSRHIWITDLENATSKFPYLGAGYSDEEKCHNWNLLKQSGVYEIKFFGDLIIHAIARGCHKNILIFNTSPEAEDPIYVIEAKQFGGFLDSDIPVVLGYNLVHYESLHPKTEDDIKNTKALVQKYVSGMYTFSKEDIPYLISSNEKHGVNTNTDNVKSVGNKQKIQMDKDDRLICPTCQKPFKRLKSHLSKSKYCSENINMERFDENKEKSTKKPELRKTKKRDEEKCNLFVKRVQEKSSSSTALSGIQNQAETELSRKLLNKEIYDLLADGSAETLLSRIEQVITSLNLKSIVCFTYFLLVWLWTFEVSTHAV